MSKSDQYREKLRQLDDWEPYLLAESGLPGPRGNLELLQVVADEGNQAQFDRWIAIGPIVAPPNSQGEFLVACGVVGLGRLVAEGRIDLLPVLRRMASDPRWRVREGVAMALQRVGLREMDLLLREMGDWSRGSLLERRAAAAALCEPVLLKDPARVGQVLAILDRITASICEEADRKSDDFRTLRQAMGYCWSVAIAASPEQGKLAMEKWLAWDDKDVHWMMQENLKKHRLARMDSIWVNSKLAGHSVPAK
jgi:hypothetical protein